MKIPADLQPERVLVIRPRGLGDVVLSSAVIDALRRAWPSVSIDYFVERASRALLETDDRLDEIFLFRGEDDGDRLRGGGMRSAIAWIRARRPDVVVDLFSNPRTALLTAMSGARWRIGLDCRFRRYAYNVRVLSPGTPEAAHRARYAREVQLDFLREAGIVWEGEARARAPQVAADERFADAALAELGYDSEARFGAVLPGGSWESKRWSTGGFAEAAVALAERFEAPTLVLWGPPEADDAREIAAAAGASARLAPPSTLRQMSALLARCTLLVSTDCLGRHLAVIQDVPTVGVFGTTHPEDWTPAEGPYVAVKWDPSRDGPSLRGMAGEHVIARIDELLASRPPRIRRDSAAREE